MKTIKFVPESLEGTAFKGHVVVENLKSSERMKLMAKCQFQFDEKGKVVLGSDAIEKMALMIEIAEPFIKEVDIKSSDAHFKSVDDLQYGSPASLCGKILTECASLVMNGSELSGNSKAL